MLCCDVARFDDRFRRNVAEHRKLLAQFVIERVLGSADQNLRLQPISRSLAMLCWVGLVFNSPAALMYGTSVTWMITTFCAPDFEHELPDRFQERQPFDVAGGATDLGDDDSASLHRRARECGF